MSKPNIRSLNPLDFTKVLPKRNEIIDNAKAEKLPELLSYKANQIANALHPSYQVLKVKDVKEENADVKTFTLEREGEAPAYFSAGQYLSIAVEIDGKYYSRPYSISSSPKDALNGFYCLTVKRTEGGLVSNYVLDNVKAGDVIITSAPLGQFKYEPLRDAKHVIGIAGGSGITPFRSLAKAIADGDEDCSLTLLYGSNTLDEALFKEEFKELEEKCSKIKVVHVLSDEKADGYETGFIGADLIRKYAPEGEYSLFMCGPQAMYSFLEKEIPKLNLRRKFIRREAFGEIHSPEAFPDYVKPGAEEYNLTVKMGPETFTMKANTGDTLLVTMEKNGLFPPADCRSGLCGWCHAQLVSGEAYTIKQNDGRRAADKKFGYIHPCIAFPLSDIVLDVPQGKDA